MFGPPPALHPGATEDDIHDGWAPARDAEAAPDLVLQAAGGTDVHPARGRRPDDSAAGAAATEGAA